MKTCSSYIVYELKCVNSNTLYHGFGDYSEYFWRRTFTDFADTETQTKAHVRRMRRPETIHLGGRSPNRRLELESTVNVN